MVCTIGRVSDPRCIVLLVRWATGTRLTNRLPNLSLVTLPAPLWNSGVLGFWGQTT